MSWSPAMRHEEATIKLKTVTNVAFSVLGGNSPAFIEKYSNSGSSTGANDSTLPHDRHYTSVVDDLLPQACSSDDEARFHE